MWMKKRRVVPKIRPSSKIQNKMVRNWTFKIYKYSKSMMEHLRPLQPRSGHIQMDSSHAFVGISFHDQML